MEKKGDDVVEQAESYSRRDFLKVGAAAGATLVATGTLAGCASGQEAAAGAQEKPAATEGQDAPAAVENAETQGDVIYVVDVLHCKPGDGEALYRHYQKNYVPGAEARGMTLVNASVNPPIWLTDDASSNTLEFVWSVPGMMGWAAMVGVSRYDPEIGPALIDFWRDVDDRVLSRTRTRSAPESDVGSLTTLAALNAGA